MNGITEECEWKETDDVDRNWTAWRMLSSSLSLLLLARWMIMRNNADLVPSIRQYRIRFILLALSLAHHPTSHQQCRGIHHRLLFPFEAFG